jgi:hypothetical protein
MFVARFSEAAFCDRAPSLTLPPMLVFSVNVGEWDGVDWVIVGSLTQ